jgi:hypothetical protein
VLVVVGSEDSTHPTKSVSYFISFNSCSEVMLK